jgi:hypothetical protein
MQEAYKLKKAELLNLNEKEKDVRNIFVISCI